MIALVAWTGLAALLIDEVDYRHGAVLAAIWSNLRYFTDVSNLLIAITMTALAIAPRRVSPRWFGMPLVATIMASAVFYGLLGGLQEILAGGLGTVLAHAVVPAATVLLWLVMLPARQLDRRYILSWVVFPLAYTGYAIVRGSTDGIYPYFFLDVSRLGPAVALYVAAILVLFLLIALTVVAVDRRR